MRREHTAAWGFLLFLGLPLTAQGAVKEFKQPNAYAVIMGISQYRAAVIPKVSYAVKDAQAIATLLETQAGIPKTHIKLLTDANVTLSDLRNHLGKWLQMRVKPDSTVYVYYAGHGTPNLQAQSGSIVPWDGHPDFPDGLYPLKELQETLSKLSTKNVVVFLDSCFSGGDGGRTVLAKGARPMGLSYPVLSTGEVMVLAAATGSQISSDYDKAEHGLFTHYLLTGLQGEADADKDQIVTLRELVPYVKERVAHTAVDELNREQIPVLLPDEQSIGKRLSLALVSTAQVFTHRAAERNQQEQMAPTRQLEAQKLARATAEREALEQERLKLERERLEFERRKLEEERKQFQVAKAPAFQAPQQAERQIPPNASVKEALGLVRGLFFRTSETVLTGGNIRTKTSPRRFDSCDIEFETRTDYDGQRHTGQTKWGQGVESLSLGNLDPASAVAQSNDSGAWFIKIKVAPGKNQILYRYDDFLVGGGKQSDSTTFDGETFNFSNEADAKYAASALQHAITLCGGKPAGS